MPSKVTWIGIIVFGNRKEDMRLYHFFKLIILLFDFIMMFDIGMFLMSLTQTTLVENTGLNAKYLKRLLSQTWQKFHHEFAVFETWKLLRCLTLCNSPKLWFLVERHNFIRKMKIQHGGLTATCAVQKKLWKMLEMWFYYTKHSK